MKIGTIVASAVALAAWAGAACAETPPMTPELAKVIEGAKAEGSISLRSTNTILGGPEGAKILEQRINDTFGTHLTVDWTPGPAYGPLAAILYQELQAGQKASTDVYVATAVQITPYFDKGLFQKVDWVKLMPSRITPAMAEGEGRALRFSTATPGILYNAKAAPWAADIRTTADLLKPEYKGKFDTTPFLGGFDVLLAPENWGVEKTTAYVRKFSQQVGGIAGCEATDRIASGEIPALVVDCSGSAGQRLKYRGKGVFGPNQIIRDMAQMRPGYFGIPANAPHPNAARLLVLYMMTYEGQETTEYDLFGGDLYDFPDSHARKEIDALKAQGVKFIEVTTDWWASHPGLDAENAALAKILRDKQ